ETPAAPPVAAAPTATAAPASRRASVNLQGAAGQRNENVQVTRIDTDVQKESNIRLGSQYTPVLKAASEQNFYSVEHGNAPAEKTVVQPAAIAAGWHGELFESHRNSLFNSRTFFQVGGVKPSRENRFGGRFTGPVKGLGWLTGSYQQNKIRGMVNGNVLVPLASERTPLATDPTVRAIVGRYLDAYPQELPNRPDFDPRALNTNSPQRIDELQTSLRLDRDFGTRHHLSALHTLSRQRVDAFELVAGQNPDMDIHNHRSRLAWHTAVSPATAVDFGAGFTRVRSFLRPESHAVGPRVRIGYQVEELGPDSHFPIDRAQNTYSAGTLLAHRGPGGRHQWTFGGDFFRFQTNGSETKNNRGEWGFTNNFGRLGIDNLRMGAASYYFVTIGEMARGFRNSQANLYAGDQWKAHRRLQIYYGLRYSLETAPAEVGGIDPIPYRCDCNNVSPRFSITAEAPGGWIVRAGYTVSFAQIPAVTYGQVRYNLPGSRYVQIQNPDSLVAPLRNLNLNDPNGRSSPTFFSPDLVSPYSHQYGLTLERKLGAYAVRTSYFGSRTIKLLNPYTLNRAEMRPGVKPALDNVDARRADPRYYDVNYIVNGGNAYLDGGQIAFEAPFRRGLAWSLNYTFSKAIDQGVDYTGTAANRDVSRGRSQSQYDSLSDRKGLSNFDSPHALLFSYLCELPRLTASNGAWSWLLNNWQVSGAGVLKNGTPLTLYVGSDAPGFGNIDGGSSDRPSVVDPTILGKTIGNPDVALRVMARDRFAYIREGETRGNMGKNTLRKGPIRNFNFALGKQWKWGSQGERNVLLRGEATNLSNTPQFDEPQRNLTSPSFGRITNTLNEGRVIQFVVRFLI
ncbi:MAG: hypothetical protein ACKV22_12260, partial [Bryobacteraceae bacterium]